MAIMDSLRDWLIAPVLSALTAEQRTRLHGVESARAYRLGQHRETLRVDTARNQPNDNVTLNFIGLAVSRSVSLLFGKGFEINLPGDDNSADQEYIETVLNANKQEILFHSLALYGAEAGTYYLRIIPDGVRGYDGALYPRLMMVDPAYVTIETDPEDIEIVLRYVIQYPITGPDGKPALRKITIEPGETGDTWQTVYSIVQGQVEIVADTQPWSYDFPPMLHGKNLPSVGTPYGEPDITQDIIRAQDRVNFLASNISKIIRLYAHPRMWGKQLGKADRMDWGPDEMPVYNNSEAEINQVAEMGDLEAAQQFYVSMRQALHDVMRSVDISSNTDKIGSLTNFGLRVLYQDAQQKLATKRELYGDFIQELVRRLLVIHGSANPDPGQIVWPDPLPAAENEMIAGLQFDLDNGLISPQTAALKRGYDYETEREKINQTYDGTDTQ